MTKHHHLKDYEILIEGKVLELDDDRLAVWSVQESEGGTSLLLGKGIDSSALYGAISALRDRGIILLAVRLAARKTGKENEAL